MAVVTNNEIARLIRRMLRKIGRRGRCAWCGAGPSQWHDEAYWCGRLSAHDRAQSQWEAR